MQSVCARSLSQTNGPFGEYKLHCTSGNLVSISPQLIHRIDKRNNEQEFVEFEKLNTIINLPSCVLCNQARSITAYKYGRLSSLPAFWSKSDKGQLYSQARNMRVEHGEVIMFFRVALGAYFSRIARG